VTVASVGADAHSLAAAETGFEDGTINFLGLPAVEIGLRYLERVGIDVVHDRVQWLRARSPAEAAAQHAIQIQVP
jgi:selenocysteine lyase/cysteine desulfurase